MRVSKAAGVSTLEQRLAACFDGTGLVVGSISVALGTTGEVVYTIIAQEQKRA